MNKAAWNHNETCLKQNMLENHEKLQNIKNDNFGRKENFSTKNIEDCRMAIKVRSKMVNVKEHFKGMNKNKKNGLTREACSTGCGESQSHVLSCSDYEKFREGLNMSQLKDGILQGGACPQGQDGHKLVQEKVDRIPAVRSKVCGGEERITSVIRCNTPISALKYKYEYN